MCPVCDGGAGLQFSDRPAALSSWIADCERNTEPGNNSPHCVQLYHNSFTLLRRKEAAIVRYAQRSANTWSCFKLTFLFNSAILQLFMLVNFHLECLVCRLPSVMFRPNSSGTLSWPAGVLSKLIPLSRFIATMQCTLYGLPDITSLY